VVRIVGHGGCRVVVVYGFCSICQLFIPCWMGGVMSGGWLVMLPSSGSLSLV